MRWYRWGRPKADTGRALRHRLAQAERNARDSAEVQQMMLRELTALRSITGSLGGTLGTVETHLQQVTQMFREWRAESGR